jgi:4'-phosphopantetheinyl transferase
MRWLARGEHQVPRGDGWLTPAEQARASAMRFTKRRNEYRLRRFAGKAAVAAAVGLPDDPPSLGRIGVLNRWTGAPYVQVDGADLGMDVSLTDRAGWAVCLVGADLAAVGCDLEIVEPRSEGFVTDFLTPAEQSLVRATPGADGPEAMANLIWSAKESALKVLRTGLRADTRSVQIAVADPALVGAAGAGWHSLVASAGERDFPGWWRRDGGFVLTLVSGQQGCDPPVQLPGSADLAAAVPVHSWLGRPLAD